MPEAVRFPVVVSPDRRLNWLESASGPSKIGRPVVDRGSVE